MFFTENQLGTVIPEVVTEEMPTKLNADGSLKVDQKLKEEKQNQINFKSKKREINNHLYSNDDESMPEVIDMPVVACLKEKQITEENGKIVDEVKPEVKVLDFQKKIETDSGKKRIKLVPL